MIVPLQNNFTKNQFRDHNQMCIRDSIKAFTEDDPDGNGKDDTYGFTYSGNDIYNTGWVSDPVNVFSAYSGKFIPGVWQEDEDGNLQYGSINEENKEALTRMAEWLSLIHI